jgi:hypothetical protein
MAYDLTGMPFGIDRQKLMHGPPKTSNAQYLYYSSVPTDNINIGFLA